MKARMTALTTLAVSAAVCPVAASAQTAPAAAEAVSAPAPAPEKVYTDADLKAFAHAAHDVSRVYDRYLPRLDAPGTAAEVDRANAAATQEMLQTVEKDGLSPDQYRAMLGYVQLNPDAAEKVRKFIDDESH